MKLATNQQGRNSFNAGDKSPVRRSRNGNLRKNKLKQNKFQGLQKVDNEAGLQGRNSPSSAVNKPNKFFDNIDEEVIKNINDIKDQATSESDDEVEDQVYKRQEGETSGSETNSNEIEYENEFNANSSEEEAGGDNNSMETNSEKSEEEDMTKQKQNVTRPLNLLVTDPEEKKKRNARTIDISNLPPSIKQTHLEKFLSKYGKIEDIKLHVDGKFSKKKGTATVLFESVEAADKSREIQAMNYQGKYLLVRKRVTPARDEDNTHSIYVTWDHGVDTGLFISTIESLYGTTTNVIVSRNKKFVFVHFESPDSVKLAVATGTITIGSFLLVIRAAVKNESRKLPQSQVEHQIKGKAQSEQHHQKVHAVLQNHKNNFTKPQTLNRNGNQGPNRGLKQQHNVKTGFVQKRRY